MFVFPGKIVSREVIVFFKGGTISVSPRVLINSNKLIKCLKHFNKIIPSSIRRPAILIFGGCTSYYNSDIINKATEINIVLVIFIENANNIF